MYSSEMNIRKQIIDDSDDSSAYITSTNNAQLEDVDSLSNDPSARVNYYKDYNKMQNFVSDREYSKTTRIQLPSIDQDIHEDDSYLVDQWNRTIN